MYSDIYYEPRIKGLRYAREVERARMFDDESARLQGDNGVYTLKQFGGHWFCNCEHFRRVIGAKAHLRALFCAHTIAIEWIIANKLADIEMAEEKCE